MQTWTFASPDAAHTLELGAELGRAIGAHGLAIALIGPLGAGKTVFVKGLAIGLGLDARVVSSPTFVIAQQYALPKGPETLHHVDLYRLESVGELDAVGFEDMLAPGQVAAVEWADRFPDVLGPECLTIEFDGPSPEEEDAAREGTAWRGRRGQATASGVDAEQVLADWAARVDTAARASGGAVVSTPEMRMVSILLVLLGLLLLGRGDNRPTESHCDVLVSLDSDALGTSHAACALADSQDRGTPDRNPVKRIGDRTSGAGLDGIVRLLDGGAIDINLASVSLLQSLPEIGPVRAAAIDRARRDWRFARVEDLERVAGIGPKTRTKIERWVYVAEDDRAAKSTRGRDDRDD